MLSEHGIGLPETWWKDRYSHVQWSDLAGRHLQESDGYRALTAQITDFRSGLQRDLPAPIWEKLVHAWSKPFSLHGLEAPNRTLPKKAVLFQQLLNEVPVAERTPERVRESIQRLWTPMAVRLSEALVILRDPQLYRDDIHPQVVLNRLWNTAAESAAEGMTATFQGVQYDRRIGGRTPAFWQVRSGNVTVSEVIAAMRAGDDADTRDRVAGGIQRVAMLQEVIGILRPQLERSPTLQASRLNQVLQAGSAGRYRMEITHTGAASRVDLTTPRWRVTGPTAPHGTEVDAFLKFLVYEEVATAADPSYDNAFRYAERHLLALDDPRDVRSLMRRQPSAA